MPRLPQKPSYLIIRFAMYGCTNRKYFRIVVMPNKKPRQGRHLEQLGSYDPLPNMNNEKLVAINFERLKYWIANGAQLSLPVEKLLGKISLLLLCRKLLMHGQFGVYMSCTSKSLTVILRFAVRVTSPLMYINLASLHQWGYS